MKKALTRLIAGAAALGVLGGGAIAVADLHKAPVLVVDGTETKVAGFFGSVGDVLESQGITLGEHDVVSPKVESSVQDDDVISVRYGRELELVIDGKPEKIWTHELDLASALRSKGYDPDRLKLSEDASRSLSRDPLTVIVTTPKKVTVTVDGKEIAEEPVATTVGDALKAMGITLDGDDRVEPALDTQISADTKITVKRVTVEEVTRTEEVPFEKTTQKDSSLEKGKTKIKTEGVVGQRTVVEKVTTVDGTVEATEELSSEVTKKPVTQVTLVGSKQTAPTPTSSPSDSDDSDSGSGSGSSSGQGINLANEAMWDKIAQCESSGNWSINTGNGYYGGLQFDLQTWRSVNGTDFAAYPHQASRAEQITVANRLYAQRGLQPWGCKP